MAYDLQVSKTFSLSGKTYSHSETLSADSVEALEVSIPIAVTGVLTVRTDNDTGTLTMDSASHGITTGAKIDLYWTGGQRHYMTVGTVAGTSVPIDLGTGVNLPVATTAVIAAVVQEYTVSIAGSTVLSLLASADFTRCQIVLLSGGTVEELAIHLLSGQAYDWLSTSSVANPITGDSINKVRITTADTASARNVRVVTQLDS